MLLCRELQNCYWTELWSLAKHWLCFCCSPLMQDPPIERGQSCMAPCLRGSLRQHRASRIFLSHHCLSLPTRRQVSTRIIAGMLRGSAILSCCAGSCVHCSGPPMRFYAQTIYLSPWILGYSIRILNIFRADLVSHSRCSVKKSASCPHHILHPW